MKPWVFCVVIALAMLLGAAITMHFTPECPQAAPPDPRIEAQFDSLRSEITTRDTTIMLLELQLTTPAIDGKLDKAMEFVRAAGYDSKLDTLLARPF
jgi:hypothetical protein